MSESRGAMRAVDRMVDAIRADEPPELDFDAIERSLLQRIARGEGARPAARPSSGAWRVLAFAAAAALIPVALSQSGQSSAGALATSEAQAIDVAKVKAAPGEAGALGDRDLRALHSGDAVEATDRPVTFSEPGTVRWTLSPDSRLTVRSPLHEEGAGARPGIALKAPELAPGVGHVVRLERGSLHVEVEPDLMKHGLVDVLAVEAGNTRVAVHGTAFTVTLRDGEVLVDVEHGVVTVGPAGQRGATTGYQLTAGSRAAFSLDGGRQARWLAREAPQPIAAASAPRAPDLAPPPQADPPSDAPEPQAIASDDVPQLLDPPAVRSAKPPPGSKSAPPAPDVEKPANAAEPAPLAPPAPAKPILTTGEVQAGLKRCFLKAHPVVGVDVPKLTASSTFLLQIDADGTILSARFNPPLPSIQGCAAFVYSGKLAPGAPRTVTIPVSLSQ